MGEDRFSEADVARYWDDNAPGWAEQVRQGHDLARERINNPAFLTLVDDVRGRCILDAGCGDGYNARILARAGADVTGVDISARMIELARAEERRTPLGIRYVHTSYAELGMFTEAAFDAVLSFMALMDGPRLDRAVQEFFRVLRPGGMLAFSITHPCFMTKGSYWIRDESGRKVKWVVSQYFNPAPWVERWRFTDAPPEAPEFAVPRFDRTLSDYLNALLDAGFRLRRIGEPRPSEEYCEQHPSQRGWRDHAALFLHVRAEKP